jgi:hypothetical protein
VELALQRGHIHPVAVLVGHGVRLTKEGVASSFVAVQVLP